MTCSTRTSSSGIFAKRPHKVQSSCDHDFGKKRSAWGLGWLRCPPSNPRNTIAVRICAARRPALWPVGAVGDSTAGGAEHNSGLRPAFLLVLPIWEGLSTSTCKAAPSMHMALSLEGGGVVDKPAWPREGQQSREVQLACGKAAFCILFMRNLGHAYSLSSPTEVFTPNHTYK